MNSRPTPALLTSFTAAVLLLAGASLRAAPRPQDPPDLTRGGTVPERANHDWNLGATGARGWMHSHKMVTSLARQVAITEVAQGSPADGVLKVGDVILGVEGQPFSRDPRTELGTALTRAESKAGRGRLRLQRWRAGKTKNVVVKLPVLGDYSESAPFDCAKSRRIFEQGCAALAGRMAESSYRPKTIPRTLNALALLASGQKRYLPLVQREARWAADFSSESFRTWYYGYLVTLLAEYVIATGDETVMPGMRRLALEAASGQSAVGSWGHDFARSDGRLRGYGMMNAPGLPLTISLVLARAAGVQDSEVGDAIERSVRLLRFYIGKGAVPYGDHAPWIQTHEDNGKCSMAAVLFDLLGDPEGATFFSRMSTASHGAERDTGHTGNFFNLLWAMPAVALSGPDATGAWMQEYGAWYLDLARRHDGTFRHQGPPQERKDKYAGWDATGAFLLAYAQPLQKIVLTGLRPNGLQRTVAALDADAAAGLIADGRGWNNLYRTRYLEDLDDGTLLGQLGSWSPVVRERAAIALGRRKAKVVPALVRMLASGPVDARIGACQALAQLRGAAAPAIPALRTTLDHDHMWLRIKAAEALAAIGTPAMAAVPSLLERLALSPRDPDPRGMEQRYLCFVLFDRRKGMLRRSLDGVDRDALHAAIRAGLKNDDGRARSAIASVYENMPFEQIEPLLASIHDAIMESAPSGIMFADGIRMAGLRLLAKHRVREGIAACAFYVRHQKKHGSQKRVPQVLEILVGYGAHARAVIPDLQSTADYFENDEQRFPKKLSRQKAAAVRDAIRTIEAATERPTLIDLK